MRSRNGLLLFAVLGGMFLAMLDQTIVAPRCRGSPPSWAAPASTPGW
ncbi:hypothetical protein [Microbispora sp. GKU 823]|nr:hypothetical protein [Microbispora sp. GKU 823]